MATHTSRADQINALRNKAILSALEHALMLADPECDDVKIRPLADTFLDEQEWRREQAAFLNSYVTGPLLDAIRMVDLGTYARVHAPRAAALIDELDAGIS